MLFQQRSPFQLYYCEPTWSWSPSTLVDYDIWCVLGGLGQLELGGVTHPLSAGTCFLLRPGDHPRGSHDPAHPLTVFAGHFQLTAEEDPAGFCPWAPGPVQIADQDVLQAAIRLLLHFQSAGASDPRGVSVALTQLLHFLGAAPGQGPRDEARRRLRRLTEAVDRKLAYPWRIGELAQIAGLSRAQLHRVFRAAYELAPMEYVARQRTDRARALLRESDMSLEQIAEALGFADVHYFSRQFLRQTGQRPGAYRRGPRP